MRSTLSRVRLTQLQCSRPLRYRRSQEERRPKARASRAAVDQTEGRTSPIQLSARARRPRRSNRLAPKSGRSQAEGRGKERTRLGSREVDRGATACVQPARSQRASGRSRVRCRAGRRRDSGRIEARVARVFAALVQVPVAVWVGEASAFGFYVTRQLAICKFGSKSTFFWSSAKATRANLRPNATQATVVLNPLPCQVVRFWVRQLLWRVISEAARNAAGQRSPETLLALRQGLPVRQVVAFARQITGPQ